MSDIPSKITTSFSGITTEAIALKNKVTFAMSRTDATITNDSSTAQFNIISSYPFKLEFSTSYIKIKNISSDTYVNPGEYISSSGDVPVLFQIELSNDAEYYTGKELCTNIIATTTNNITGTLSCTIKNVYKGDEPETITYIPMAVVAEQTAYSKLYAGKEKKFIITTNSKSSITKRQGIANISIIKSDSLSTDDKSVYTLTISTTENYPVNTATCELYFTFNDDSSAKITWDDASYIKQSNTTDYFIEKDDNLSKDGSILTITKYIKLPVYDETLSVQVLTKDYKNHALLSALTYDYNKSSIIPLTSPICNKWGTRGTIHNNQVTIGVYDTNHRQYYSIERYIDKIWNNEEDSNFIPLVSSISNSEYLTTSGNLSLYKMNGRFDGLSPKEYIIKYGKFDGLATSKIILYPINDSKGEFLMNGKKYILSSSDTNKLNIRNLNNFSVYILNCDSKPKTSNTDSEIFIDYINREIYMLSYVNMQQEESHFEDYQGKTKNTIYYECNLTSYKLKDIHTDSYGKIMLGDMSFDDDDNVILYTDNVIIDVKKGKLYENLDSSVYNIGEEGNFATNNILDEYCSSNDYVYIYRYSMEKKDPATEYSLGETTENISVYVKTDDKNYSTIYSSIASISVENAIKKQDASVFTYQENLVPITNDLYIFQYSGELSDYVDESPENHLKINNIENLSQLWFKKYSNEPNYCYQDASINTISPFKLRDRYKNHMKPINIAIDFSRDYNIMKSPFDLDFYKKYTKTYVNGKNNEITFGVNNVSGYSTGYLLKNFINSVSVNMKNAAGVLTIDLWVNTKMVDGKIYFDLTNSIIQKIVNDYNFNKTYNKLGIKDNNSKMNMIKNTIMPNLRINTKNKIEVYYTPSESISYINKKSSGMIKASNIDTELINENGIYWVKVTPETDKKYLYYIKYNIEL